MIPTLCFLPQWIFLLGEGGFFFLTPAESFFWLNIQYLIQDNHLVFISACATEKQRFIFLLCHHNLFYIFILDLTFVRGDNALFLLLLL